MSALDQKYTAIIQSLNRDKEKMENSKNLTITALTDTIAGLNETVAAKKKDIEKWMKMSEETAVTCSKERAVNDVLRSVGSKQADQIARLECDLRCVEVLGRRKCIFVLIYIYILILLYT